MYLDQVGDRRQASAKEIDLLQRMLDTHFQGSAELRRQLSSIVVEQIDRNGSLLLRPISPTPAMVSRRIPVEATYPDSDGVLVHVLIHVRDGVLNELEIYREDSGDVLSAAVDALVLEIEAWAE
ncbi:DUF6984 family protein [Arthrobacter rhizosphaerae]|uniref:DUF6984 family protein n=1 Tax=Arthrobacter rhizosphaerae TaxID=2855490 RepID=UPI001FF40A86|nr:hypothetical protein [Arthrobacter rhizosphaerae]